MFSISVYAIQEMSWTRSWQFGKFVLIVHWPEKVNKLNNSFILPLLMQDKNLLSVELSHFTTL